jgi:hypothetical protein
MSLILSGDNGLSDIDGSAATPAIRGTDANTGIFFPAADTIAFSEGGVEAMRIDSSGNVGIGVTPAAKLDVYNSAAAAPNNEILRLRYQTSTTAGHSGDLNFTNSAGTVNARMSSVVQDGNNVALAFGTFSGSIAEQARITSTGLMQFNSGYGSVATAYGCRAWVNFNGSGTVAIRASGNVSSITDNGVGNYTANFATAMPDTNYAATAINDLTSNGAWYVNPYIYGYNTGSVQYINASSYDPNLNAADCVRISIAVFR